MRRKDLSILGRLLAIVVIVVLAFPSQAMAAPLRAAGSHDPRSKADQKPSPAVPDEDGTPFQQALKAALEERQELGLPVPASVAYDQRLLPTIKGRAAAGPDGDIKIVATTTVHFDHPQQAGFARWPDLVVEDSLPPHATGTVLAGDYTQRVRDALEHQFPGIWEEYDYGYEPRRYTVEETLEITHLGESLRSSLLQQAEAPGSIAVGQILMGFSYPGPHVDYTLHEKWEECLLGICLTVAEAKAGLEVGWDLGLRLPVEVSLTTPSQMNQGRSYWLSSALTPLNWTATDYARAGVPAEKGNEYLLQFVFFAGFKVWILGAAVVNAAIDMNYDASQSFTTPLGPGASFPVASVNLPPGMTGLQACYAGVACLGIGLVLDPRVGSTHITAGWRAVPGSDASGQGQIAYSSPGAPVSLGPVTAADLGPTDFAKVELMGFRYWFTEFSIRLSAYLQVTVFGYGVRTGSFKIADVSLPSITGGPWIGVHKGTPGSVVGTAWVGAPIGPLDHVTYLPMVRR